MPTIEEILRAAKEAGASDVHLTVGIPPKMRVNGNLITMDYPKMLPADTLEVLVNIMTEVQRERFEERGEYDMSFSIPNCGRYRVNAYKQRGSVALAFRLVGTVVPSPEELGVPESVVDLYQRKRGLVLVTGPTGSGKSTTLAAIIDKINNNRDAHVITLEDPIEYLHQHKMSMVNQREIGIDSNNYANALRAALREDPDVILVGEMRDFETISVAITAAETGHLVLSTLHTIGAAPEGALDIQRAVQRGHDGIHQCQTNTAAAHRVAALVELGLYVFQILRRDAASLVDDLHKGLVLPCPQLDRDAPAGGRVFDGVIQNIDEHLPQTVRVGVDRDHLLRLGVVEQQPLP